MNKRNIGIFTGLLIIALWSGYYLWDSPKAPISVEIFEQDEVVLEESEQPSKFGLPLGLFKTTEGRIKRNQTFADILLPYNLTRQEIYTFDKISRPVHSVRNLVVNKKYTIFYRDEEPIKAAYFVYEPNDTEYVVYQIEDSLSVYKELREIDIIEKTMSGVITQSLDHSIREQGGSAALVNAMADIYGWSLDFRSLQKGDWFKVVYEDRIVDGVSVGIGNIIGAEFNHVKNTYMIYAYDQGDGLNYFDQNGESVQKAFLRYPVEYSRISSRYNPRRYLKMYGRVKPHLGTDYAATRGTPIKAAADGIITARGFTKPNGNYVKIKHNGTYTTGYLHMSRFGKFRVGQRVKKGQTIGYVGKTGYATGYHLCFRFWKHGKQVDFLREKLPAEKPLTDDQMDRFGALMTLTNKKLDDIPSSWADKTVSASNSQ